MVHDVGAQVPSDVAFFLVDQDENQATLLHVLEKVYLPGSVFLDNCEPGQSCQHVGSKLYEQPDSLQSFKWFPFSRSYVIKVLADGPPESSLVVDSVLTGYDANATLCKIESALGN